MIIFKMIVWAPTLGYHYLASRYYYGMSWFYSRKAAYYRWRARRGGR